MEPSSYLRQKLGLSFSQVGWLKSTAVEYNGLTGAYSYSYEIFNRAIIPSIMVMSRSS